MEADIFDLTTIALLWVLTLVYSFVGITLVARILGKIKHYNIILTIISLFNATALTYFVLVFNVVSYPLITILFVVEIVILFRGPLMALLTIAFTILLHLFAFRAIAVSVTSNILNISQKQVVISYELFLLTFAIAVFVHILAFLLFMFAFKPKDLKIIVDNVELLSFVFPVAILVQLYLMFNSSIFSIDTFVSEINTQQIILPIFLVASFYVTLFMTLRFIQLHGYKKKSIELEEMINKDDIIRHAFFSASDIVIEVNCTEDKVTRYLIDKIELPLDEIESFSEFLGNRIRNIIHPEDKVLMQMFSVEKLISSFNDGNTQLSCEFRALKPYLSENNDVTLYRPNEFHWFKLIVKTQSNKINDNVISIFTIDDITEQKNAEIELRKKAERDPLTGAFNRVGISARINKHLANGEGGTLFMFDLDNFKGINDNMGHAAGDKVLVEVYENVLKLFRSHDLVARIGGDEFNIFLPSLVEMDIIVNKAQLICETVEKVYHADNGVDIRLSSSIGVCRAPIDANSYIEMVKNADIAMYDSKHRGKNTYTIYDSSVHKTFNPKSSADYQR